MSVPEGCRAFPFQNSALAKEGHTQIVLAGIARGEQMDMPDGVKAYPVYFESEGLPYPVVGMSDEMPYISTRYKDMTEEMTVQFRNAFLAVLDEVIIIRAPCPGCPDSGVLPHGNIHILFYFSIFIGILSQRHCKSS